MSASYPELGQWIVETEGPFVSAAASLCAHHAGDETSVLSQKRRDGNLDNLHTVHRNAQAEVARSRIGDVHGVNQQGAVRFICALNDDAAIRGARDPGNQRKGIDQSRWSERGGLD